MPMKKIWCSEAVFEKPEAFNHAGPSPIGMAGSEYVDLQHVAGLSSLDPNRSGERVHSSAVDIEVLRCSHARTNLAATGVDALESDFIPGGDAQSRSQRTVPDGVGWFSGKNVFGHDSATLTVICNSTSALRGKALT